MFQPEGAGSASPIEMDMQPLFRKLLDRGFTSYLRVPVHLRGGVMGGMVFCSAAPRAYSSADLARARQIASVVALALAHQRLAEEEQRSAEARDRADKLEQRVQRLTEQIETQERHRVLGHSRPWKDVLDQATKVAGTEATVLLSGESGTGKEVVARFIHRASHRAEGPFVALNCAALPEQILESELFGHEKGAFTGALSTRPGRIEQAAGGVLFLDEVGELSPPVQAKFLRVLQEREYQRVGGARTLKADIRVIAATNRNLKAAIASGGFREDLYYRLAVFELTLPPLRERPEDIPLLVNSFLAELARTLGRPAPGVSPEAYRLLTEYSWPGNVRELRNALERAMVLCGNGIIQPAHLPVHMQHGIVASPRRRGMPLPWQIAPGGTGGTPAPAGIGSTGIARGPSTPAAAERE
jgi:transcriptional regulator with GAF, ATPase, and Fis domain